MVTVALEPASDPPGPDEGPVPPSPPELPVLPLEEASLAALSAEPSAASAGPPETEDEHDDATTAKAASVNSIRTHRLMWAITSSPIHPSSRPPPTTAERLSTGLARLRPLVDRRSTPILETADRATIVVEHSRLEAETPGDDHPNKPEGRSLPALGCWTMKRSEKADRIGEILDDLYPTPPIPLDHTDPYTLLVAVALSAQTTDKKVNEVTPALFAVASTPEEMAALDPERILELIKEIGLAPTKAKNLSKMAYQILDDGGEIRPDWEFLESLAGVGHKTASVVMAQAFGVPAFPVDTHIHRLADRWGLSNGSTVEKTERDLKAVFPEDTWNRRHLQIIFFGREYCPARNHDLAQCPICGWAATKKRIAAEAAPKRRPKKPAAAKP
jgi:endonuclease-3